jgi:hypothetical protein
MPRVQRPVVGLIVVAAFACSAAPPAQAVSIPKPVCTLAGLVSSLAGKLCTIATRAGGALKVGQKLLGGHLGGALHTGAATAGRAIGTGVVLASIAAWVTGGAKFVLHAVAQFTFATTRPQLQSTWFSASYWRMAAISALLTLPFLFAAAIQAVIGSDPALLVRSALGYLPLGMLAVAIATPVAMLLVSASDEMSAIVSGAAGGAGAGFLDRAAFATGALTALSGSTFVALFIGVLTVAATVTLWVELLIRSAAIEVVVLMLPLFFAALVWPARRIWAVRAVELLVALILSKFVIAVVLSLGGAALGHAIFPGLAAGLSGVTLVILAAFSPWALLRLLPLHELAGGIEGLRDRSQSMLNPGRAEGATELAEILIRRLPGGPVQSSQLPDESSPSVGAVRRLGDEPRDPGVEHASDDATSETAAAPGPEPGTGPGSGSEAADPPRGSADAADDPPPGPAHPIAVADGARWPLEEPVSRPSTGAGDGRPEMEAHWYTESGGWPVLHLPSPPSHPPGASGADERLGRDDQSTGDKQSPLPPPEERDP